jgi:prevent-host-death family protein
MADKTIKRGELRSRLTKILAKAEAGTEFTITVRGRPVARLGPVERDDVDAAPSSAWQIVPTPLAPVDDAPAAEEAPSAPEDPEPPLADASAS